MSSIVLSGDTSGSVTVSVPAVSGSNTVTIPAVTGTVMVSSNMPAFSYYQSAAQTLANSTATKITFTTSEFDTTGGMYASSRFTPTVSGYYQVSAGVAMGAAASPMTIYIYKNGSIYKQINNSISSAISSGFGSALVQLNGSTDYIEIYAYITIGQVLSASSAGTYFQSVMVRAA